jgi:hypothetical protein
VLSASARASIVRITLLSVISQKSLGAMP